MITPSVRRVAATAGRLCLVLGFAACGKTPAHPREIRIGLLADTTGATAVSSGIPSVAGARMAIEEINTAGGIEIAGERYPVRLIVRGYGEPAAAASAASELISTDKVDALVGPPTSQHALTVAPVAEQAGVPMITQMASHPDVTKARKFVFRMAFLDAYQGQLLASYAIDELRAKKAAVLFDASSPSGPGIAALFTQTFEGLGGTVVATATFSPDSGSDFRAQMTQLLAKSPDVLLLPNFARHDSVQMRQARAMGFRGRFLGTDHWDTESLRKVPTSLGAVVVNQWDSRTPRPATRAFVDEFVKRFGGRPRTTAAATYDAIRLLADAATRAASRDGTAWAQAIGATVRYDGVASVYRFHGTGDPSRGGAIKLIGATADSLLASKDP